MIPSVLFVSLLAIHTNLHATEMTEASLKRAPSTHKIEWKHALGPALEIAEVNNRPIVVFFTASWCGPCQSVKRTTMQNPSVIQKVGANFVPVMLDFDQNRQLASQLNVNVVPTILVLNPSADSLLYKVTNTSAGMFVRELESAKQQQDEGCIKPVSLNQ
ncbi:MAG: thioredoxin family protein [Planctomycetaceae bacterium]